MPIALRRNPVAPWACECLRTTVEALNFDPHVPGLRGAISLGVGTALPARERVEQALKRADLALYEAKEGGRNRVQWRDPA